MPCSNVTHDAQTTTTVIFSDTGVLEHTHEELHCLATKCSQCTTIERASTGRVEHRHYLSHVPAFIEAIDHQFGTATFIESSLGSVNKEHTLTGSTKRLIRQQEALGRIALDPVTVHVDQFILYLRYHNRVMETILVLRQTFSTHLSYLRIGCQ
ncbi:hypothetical protein D3C71_1671140 [compost metagenome]